jgi:hypothetical protein
MKKAVQIDSGSTIHVNRGFIRIASGLYALGVDIKTEWA